MSFNRIAEEYDGKLLRRALRESDAVKMRQPSLKVVSFLCIDCCGAIYLKLHMTNKEEIYIEQKGLTLTASNILFVKLWMNSENDKNGNFNQNGVVDCESMATVLVNTYKLEWNENSKLPKRIC